MLRRVTSLHEISQHGPLETQLGWLNTRLKIGFGPKLVLVLLVHSGLDWGGLGLGLALGVAGLVWIALEQD